MQPLVKLALDMVNFGPPNTVPEKFKDRKFYERTTITRERYFPDRFCSTSFQIGP